VHSTVNRRVVGSNPTRSAEFHLGHVYNGGVCMIIVGVNTSPHDSSVTLMIDNELIFHIEAERLSNIKHDEVAFESMRRIRDYVDHVDVLALSGTHPTTPFDGGRKQNVYEAYIYGLGRSFKRHPMKIYDFSFSHHRVHAATAFYNSGFDKALCIVKDGSGSHITKQGIDVAEIGSCFIVEYPFKEELIFQHFITDEKIEPFRVDNILITNSMSEGTAYHVSSLSLGFGGDGAGKVMGLSSYGKYDPSVPPIFDENGLISGLASCGSESPFQQKANYAYRLQTDVQDKVAKDILDFVNQTGIKNVCLSGGFFLNCVSNYNLLSVLPEDVNVYVEPMCYDAGNSLGAAKLAYYLETGSTEIEPQKTLFLGEVQPYTDIDEDVFEVIDSSYAEVAKLLADRNIVAIYQGRSESGPRSLGNRSILYDPRDPNGKDHVNVVKKREWFRPFAGTVLLDHVHDWFNMKRLKDSPFMMYGVEVLSDVRHIIPAITHVDGTCRIQTVTSEENPHFYRLIEEFYKMTNIPILLNTSFNLAGDAIVETLDNALDTLKRSEIDYLYLPEKGVVVRRIKEGVL
jgi:carbamoyltransferase